MMAEMLQPFVVQSREKSTEHELGGVSSASMKLGSLGKRDSRTTVVARAH